MEAVRKASRDSAAKSDRSGLTFGDYDLVGVLEMPDNASAAAFAMAVAAGGACKDVKTTPLLSLAEGLEAMKKAGNSGYKPVAASK